MTSKHTSVQKTLASFPKLAALTDKVLFEGIWTDPELSERDRSLITVAALVTLHRPEQLRYHLNFALENGLTKEELKEVITHLAFYAGWPGSMEAVLVANDIFEKS